MLRLEINNNEVEGARLLNPIQTGGGGIPPARTLDVHNFLIKQAKATKLGDLWGQFGVASPCLLSLTLPWQPLFDKRFFQNFEFPTF